MDKKRDLLFFRDYFQDFYDSQTAKVQKKIVIEDLDRIPELYLKHLEGTDGLFEIRVQSGRNIFRIFCFLDDNKIVVVGHGFQKGDPKDTRS